MTIISENIKNILFKENYKNRVYDFKSCLVMDDFIILSNGKYIIKNKNISDDFDFLKFDRLLITPKNNNYIYNPYLRKENFELLNTLDFSFDESYKILKDLGCEQFIIKGNYDIFIYNLDDLKYHIKRCVMLTPNKIREENYEDIINSFYVCCRFDITIDQIKKIYKEYYKKYV